jgi:transposase
MGSPFDPLKNWYNNLDKDWNTLTNYFAFKVTTSLSEGINNVIKMLKRMAFGYKNMEYFRLKIMQKCGYLNSNFIPSYKHL